MPVRTGSFGGAVNLLPTVTIGATTNFTESRGVFNATVNGNLANTTVVFHYSTASNFSSFTSVAGSGSGTGSFASSATVTGLAVNTTYYVRAVATSSIGSTTSSSTSFLTWHLIQWGNGTPGTYYLTVPTVSGVNPAPLVNALVVGGGGGGAGGSDVAGHGGGGGGGYRYTTSRAFNGASGSLTIVVAGGGGAGVGGNGGGGGTTYITGTNMATYDAGGGEGGTHGGTNPRGGNVGYGDNAGHAGGNAGSYTSNKITYYSGGGGAGVNGGGGGGYYSSGTAVGGGGGSGGFIYYSFGAGGGGNGDIGYMGANGPYYQFGSGGTAGGYFDNPYAAAAGTAGLVVFNYYGP